MTLVGKEDQQRLSSLVWHPKDVMWLRSLPREPLVDVRRHDPDTTEAHDARLKQLPSFLGIAHQREEAVEAMDELSIWHGNEQREDDADVQRQ